MTEVNPLTQDITRNITGNKEDSEASYGDDTRTDDQKKVDKQLAERLCGLIEDANERVVPLVRMIRKVR
jgi:hypothetical protein